jgi:hypothetical protein
LSVREELRFLGKIIDRRCLVLWRQMVHFGAVETDFAAHRRRPAAYAA